jgi:hypothetical protein
MKNQTLTKFAKIIPVVALLAVMLPSSVFASTDVTITSSKIQVKAGETFTVNVSVSPATAENVYTAKIALSYPANIVSATGFTLAPTWLALSQPGYDLIDNTAGSLIKTAGYPSGLSSQTLFGTVTFTALKNGTATITLTNDTQIYNSTNANIFSSTANTVQVTVATPVPTNVSNTSATGQTTNTTNTTSVDENTNPASNTTSSASTTADAGVTNTNVAAAAASGQTPSSSRPFIYILIALIVIGGGTWFLFNRKKI